VCVCVYMIAMKMPAVEDMGRTYHPRIHNHKLCNPSANSRL